MEDTYIEVGSRISVPFIDQMILTIMHLTSYGYELLTSCSYQYTKTDFKTNFFIIVIAFGNGFITPMDIL